MFRTILNKAAAARLICNCGRLQTTQMKPMLNKSAQHYLAKKAPFSTSVRRLIEDKDAKNLHEDESFANLYAETQAEAIQESRINEPELEGFMHSGVLIPTINTHKMLVCGVPFSELPVAHIKASKQNTIITITDASGRTILGQSSGGLVGFKNAAKRGSVPAQRAGFSVGQNVRREGLKNIRVLIQGIGQGRFASIHGLKLSGLNIISITDKTCDQQAKRPRRRPHK